jgi:iron complex transport system substrate-binding protein
MVSSPRIASLLPSATEIVCALGAGPDLVGVSHECDFPADAVAGLPVLTSTRVRKSPASAEIDRDVRAILRDALAVYEVDVGALERAAPDVVVTQDLCDVCAVSLADVERAVRAIARPGVRIVNLHPTRLEEVLGDVLAVGEAIGRSAEAAEVVRGIRARLESVEARAAAIPGPRPAVLTVEWLEPVMVGGTWMPELVAIAGGAALAARAGDHAPTLGPAELARLAPDVVVIKPCGFDLARTRAEIASFLERIRPFDWPATRAGRVWIADGNAYFNRPGPRIADSAEILAACVHPTAFADLGKRHARAFEPATLRDPSPGAGRSTPCSPVG